MGNLNDERRSDDRRRAAERRAKRDRRPDRRLHQERRHGERRRDDELAPPLFPETVEELNHEIGGLTAEIDRLSGQLVELLDRSRALFERRAELLKIAEDHKEAV